MKKPVWRTTNRMQIDTGHKTFDSQCDCLSTGNVAGGVQHSSFIRAWTDTECNGVTRNPGHLQDFDLSSFKMPPYLLRTVKELAREKPVILYEIRHWRGKEKYIHGWIITDTGERGYRFLKMFRHGALWKSTMVLSKVAEYISEKPEVFEQQDMEAQADIFAGMLMEVAV